MRILHETDIVKSGSSKVVDENGEPMVVYHGGRSGITEFNPDIDRNRKLKEEWDGFSIYFTKEKSLAEMYASREGKEVYETFVSLKKPNAIYC